LHRAPPVVMMRGMKRLALALLLTACMGTNHGDDPADGDGGAVDAAAERAPDAASVTAADAPTVSSPVAPADGPTPIPDAAPPPPDAAAPALDSAPPPPPPVTEPPDAAPELDVAPPDDVAPPPVDGPPPLAPLCRRVRCDCTFAGKRLVGRVKYVTFPERPDFKVKVVTSAIAADLRVQKVAYIPQLCGEWSEDPLTPELRVQIVNDGLEDFSIQYVSIFPGTF
jgi:hypothetical protein